MADQDFNIKVITTADTTGIRQTSRELEQLKNQQATFAETARRQTAAAASANQAASTSAGVGGRGGITGTAIGVGTIVTVLTAAITKWKEFNAEQDRWVDGMIKAEGELRKLGEAIVEMQDKAISARRNSTEPLEQSFIRLQQEIIKLKTEQSLLDLPTQGKEWDDLQKKINETQSALEKVRSEAEKAGKTTAEPVQPFPKAGKGESQAIVDEAERNRRAAEDALKEYVYEFDPETGGYKPSGKKQFPVFQPPPPPPITNPPPKEDMTPTPVDTYRGGDKNIGASGAEIIKAIINLEKTFLSLWR